MRPLAVKEAPSTGSIGLLLSTLFNAYDDPLSRSREASLLIDADSLPQGYKHSLTKKIATSEFDTPGEVQWWGPAPAPPPPYSGIYPVATWLEMSELADDVYSNGGSPPTGWSVVQSLTVSTAISDRDYFIIYNKGTECALGFSGTTHLADWTNNADLTPMSFCGFPEVQRGFVTELNGLLSSSEWTRSFLPTLSSEQCSGGVSVVGHSLGAAQAAIMAACANQQRRPFGFEVASVYLFGAPGMAKSPLTNGLSQEQGCPGGCFHGYQFYNQDYLSVDPATAGGRSSGYTHSKVKAVKLSRATIFSDVAYWVSACTSNCATDYPQGGGFVPNFSEHAPSVYISRIRRILDGYGVEDRQGQCR